MAPSRLFDLSGKTALVTGGARGLGEAIARALAEHGARVAIFDRDEQGAEATASSLRSDGAESLALGGDVTVEADAARAVDAVVAEWGALDVLVNNAGIAILEAAETAPMDDIKQVFDVDVFGVLAFAKQAFRPMRAQGKGCIVNMASMAGITVLRPQEHVGYNAAKAAVIMVTKSLAVEWAEFGIRVNAIAPGYMLTPPVVQLQGEDPERWSAWMDGVPMARAGEPAELQGAAVYLASDSASYVTGSIVVVDGGYSCA
jgi:NAD(P)-dependent dehydrogenase (short-subunit alcohol dehydrogenase family)